MKILLTLFLSFMGSTAFGDLVTETRATAESLRAEESEHSKTLADLGDDKNQLEKDIAALDSLTNTVEAEIQNLKQELSQYQDAGTIDASISAAIDQVNSLQSQLKVAASKRAELEAEQDRLTQKIDGSIKDYCAAENAEFAKMEALNKYIDEKHGWIFQYWYKYPSIQGGYAGKVTIFLDDSIPLGELSALQKAKHELQTTFDSLSKKYPDASPFSFIDQSCRDRIYKNIGVEPPPEDTSSASSDTSTTDYVSIMLRKLRDHLIVVDASTPIFQRKISIIMVILQ